MEWDEVPVLMVPFYSFIDLTNVEQAYTVFQEASPIGGGSLMGETY